MLHIVHRITERRRFRLAFLRRWGRSRIILSAGMPRSGSTWEYNAARLLLRRALGNDLSSGWIDDWQRLPQAPVLLLKLHEFDAFLARHAAVILYSFRDLRDALASSRRMFGTAPSLELARRWLNADRQWRAVADCSVRYEDLLTDSATLVCGLARALAVGEIHADEVLQEIAALSDRSGDGPGGYDPDSLLHRGHITDGRHGTWREWLEPELLRKLEREFHDWFQNNGYLPSLNRRTGLAP
jgi:hypothetical protein